MSFASSLECGYTCSYFFYWSGDFPNVNSFRTQLYSFFFLFLRLFSFFLNECATTDSLFISLNPVFCLVRIDRLDTHLNDLLCVVRAVFNWKKK